MAHQERQRLRAPAVGVVAGEFRQRFGPVFARAAGRRALVGRLRAAVVLAVDALDDLRDEARRPVVAAERGGDLT